MFCYNCGKEIYEKSTFCTWCGTKQMIPVYSAPAPSEAPISAQPVPEQPINRVPLSAEQPETQTDSIAEFSSPISAAEPIPEPDSPPVFRSEASEADSAAFLREPAASEQSSQPETPPQPEEQFSSEVPATPQKTDEKPRKYYTGAHLAICLVITGIMAAAAGIFAGLYFSLI